MAEFQCSQCSYQQHVPDSFLGKKVKCPKCGVPTIISPMMKAAVGGRPPQAEVSPLPAAEEVAGNPFDGNSSALLSVPAVRAPERPRGKSSGFLSKTTFATSLTALALSSALLVTFLLSPDPLGRGMDAYDFTTPEKTYRSMLAVGQSGDIRALRQLAKVREGHKTEEKIRTLKVHKEAANKGRKLLFMSFEENGIPKHTVEGFEKDADSGLWFPAYVSAYTVDDEDLKKAIKEWEAKGGE